MIPLKKCRLRGEKNVIKSFTSHQEKKDKINIKHNDNCTLKYHFQP